MLAAFATLHHHRIEFFQPQASTIYLPREAYDKIREFTTLKIGRKIRNLPNRIRLPVW